MNLRHFTATRHFVHQIHCLIYVITPHWPLILHIFALYGGDTSARDVCNFGRYNKATLAVNWHKVRSYTYKLAQFNNVHASASRACFEHFSFSRACFEHFEHAVKFILEKGRKLYRKCAEIVPEIGQSHHLELLYGKQAIDAVNPVCSSLKKISSHTRLQMTFSNHTNSYMICMTAK